MFALAHFSAGKDCLAFDLVTVGKDCLAFDLMSDANISLLMTIPLEFSLVAGTVVCLRHDVAISSVDFLISSRLMLYFLPNLPVGWQLNLEEPKS